MPGGGETTAGSGRCVDGAGRDGAAVARADGDALVPLGDGVVELICDVGEAIGAFAWLSEAEPQATTRYTASSARVGNRIIFRSPCVRAVTGPG